ncbi:ABC transporter permease [Rhodovulum sp. 12E13]|uniref:cell division protein FtsX n=1 Tax=Rhodovulum sp. 12E13 TaxID=2203891 RepID=UPI001F3A03F1|nr:FtsX-like permease family protein [Rhodovulum sp. 12E13]
MLRADAGPGRVVPPSGFTARLTLLTAAAMAVLAVFALAASLAADRVADRWAEALARTATVRVAAPAGQLEAQVAAALEVLRTTPGVASARRLTQEEEQALLTPWLGPDLPLDALPVPALIEVIEAPGGIDAAGLSARLAGEAPGAVFDDHTRWRAPLVAAAARLRGLGFVALALIGAATAAMVALAAQSALAANARVIATLRLIGARDAWIARAFVRRFTLRAAAGALAGTAAGMATVGALPPGEVDGLLGDLGLRGKEWLWPLAIPPAAAVVAFAATRLAAFRVLRETR